MASKLANYFLNSFLAIFVRCRNAHYVKSVLTVQLDLGRLQLSPVLCISEEPTCRAGGNTQL